MKIIKLTHINPTDTKGGASLAGYRLHKEFAKHPEIDSGLFVDEKYTQDHEVIKFSNFFLRQTERFFNKFGYFSGLQYFFSVNWLPLYFHRRFRETDVFLIRNIHGGMFPLWLPWWLSKLAPVIWRLPDMWPLTGHCCYSYECEKWKVKCRQCPHLRDYPGLFIDTTPFLFNLKKFFYLRSNLYIVAPSQWMLDNVKRSPILAKFPCFLIPIGVDTEVFKPAAKEKKFTLIFASGSLRDKRKGAMVLPLILARLNQALQERNIFIDLWWAGEKDILAPQLSNVSNVFLGILKESEMAARFGQAHLHILPTLADNLPNTILESLSSETPVVVFDVGGCREAVLHQENGYLVKPFDVDDFVRGILFFLLAPSRVKDAGEAGRRWVKQHFTQEKQAELYTDLIKDVVNKKYGHSAKT